MGLSSFEDLRPHTLRRNGPDRTTTYADLFDHLAPGQLLGEPPESWARDWELADPDRFRP